MAGVSWVTILLMASVVAGIAVVIYSISQKRDRNILVNKFLWADTYTFFLLCIVCISSLLLDSGITGGIRRGAMMLVDAVIFMSFYYLVLCIFLPILRSYFPEQVCAFLWITPMLLYFRVPATAISKIYLLPRYIYIPINQTTVHIIFILWMIGFLVLMAYQMIKHIQVRNMLLHNKANVSAHVIDIAQQEYQRMHMEPIVLVYQTPLLRSPLSINLKGKKPAVFLPKTEYNDDELRMIFRHELCHIRRDDIGIKIFLSICRGICWFHPLVWFAIRRGSEDIEASCDEIVVRMDMGKRKEYARLILSNAGEENGYTTCLSANGRALKYRLQRLLSEQQKKQFGGVLIAVTIFVCFFGYGSVQLTYDRGKVNHSIASVEYMLEAESNIYCIGQKADIVMTDIVAEPENEWKLTEKERVQALKYISNISVERILSGMHYNVEKERRLYLVLDDQRYITITDDIIAVNTIGKGESYYRVTSPIDWKQLSLY